MLRLIGENVENGIYTFQKATELAKQNGMDLVVVSNKAVPPVYTIVEYAKYEYKKKKKDKITKKNSIKGGLKEIKFRTTIEEGDLLNKAERAKKFLQQGYKIKLYIMYIGRTIVFQDIGKKLLDRFIEVVEEYISDRVEKRVGKRKIVILSPRKINSNA